MTDEDVVAWVASSLGLKYQKLRVRKSNWKPSYYLRITGKRAIYLMKALYPIMGTRRQAQIVKAIASYTPNEGSRNHHSRRLTESNVLEIFQRATNGESSRRLGREFEVAHTTITYIRDGKRWKWLTQPESAGLQF